ncbi:MAG: DUF4838 domain-containing protein [Armatimonadota bacterium]
MKLRLSADSRPAATVITDADAPPAVAFAARELSRYLAIITGGRYPIVEGEAAGGRAPVLRLRTGTAPHPPAPSPSRRGGDGPPRGAYSWRVDDGGVEIVGERPGAVLHAVYALLEELGCAWLHVWEGGEIIPRTPTVELPWGEHIAEPAMAHREFTNLMPINEGYVHHIDWMAKNRFNRFMVFANIAGSIDRYLELLEPEVAVRGMQATMGHHSFRYFLPPEEHFADHPEWYALLDGERSPHGQLCTSNPEVVDTVADRICEFLASHEQIEMVGLWPNDGYGWCECDACAELQPQRPSRFRPEHPRRTDTYLQFVNAVAERVREEHPDRRLSALAYVNYVEAPEAIEPAENVAVCYAPFCRCLKHPLRPDVDCDRPNAEYARELERWREVVANDLYLFCYLMQIHTLSVPYRITHMLQPNWRWLIEAGCDGYVMEFVPEEWATFGLNAHLTGRLSWEPEMDVDAWLSAYYRHLYGPAADSMEAWFRILEDSVRVAGPCTGHYDLTYAARATEDLLRSGLEVFGRARAEAATGDRRHWQAAQQAWVGLELLMRLGRWQRLLLEAREAPEPRRGPLMHRAADAAGDVLAFVRDHADSGAVESDRYERIVGGWLDEQS